MCFESSPSASSVAPPTSPPLGSNSATSAAVALALETLTTIIKDPDAKTSERRLAATAILRHAASMKALALRARSASARARPSRHHAADRSTRAPAASRRTSAAPGYVAPPSGSLEHARTAYDRGYWAAFCKLPRNRDDIHGPAAPAPGRESFSLADLTLPALTPDPAPPDSSAPA